MNTPDLAQVFGDAHEARLHIGLEPPPGPGWRRVDASQLTRSLREYAGLAALDRVRLPDGRVVPAGEATLLDLLQTAALPIGPAWRPNFLVE